jgi:DNA-binding transcriptional LysR family regulator
MDRLAALESFARVAETGSFSAAARALNLSKSLISRQISTLEAELGARLMSRTTRSLTLTEAGRSYYEQVARILAQMEEADLSVSQLQATPRGKLRVNAPMSFSLLRLAPVLPDFLALYPEIDVDVAMNDRRVDLMEEGFDLAIRIGRLADSSLIARKIGPMRRVVCASPAYFAERGLPKVPADLRSHDCLCYSNADTVDEWRFAEPDGRPISVEVKGRVRANNGDLLRLAALRGLGLVDLPSFLVGADIEAGLLVPVLQDYIRQDGGVYAVYPHALYLPPKIRVFIDFLAERWGGAADWPKVVP